VKRISRFIATPKVRITEHIEDISALEGTPEALGAK